MSVFMKGKNEGSIPLVPIKYVFDLNVTYWLEKGITMTTSTTLTVYKFQIQGQIQGKYKGTVPIPFS